MLSQQLTRLAIVIIKVRPAHEPFQLRHACPFLLNDAAVFHKNRFVVPPLKDCSSPFSRSFLLHLEVSPTNKNGAAPRGTTTVLLKFGNGGAKPGSRGPQACRSSASRGVPSWLPIHSASHTCPRVPPCPRTAVLP